MTRRFLPAAAVAAVLGVGPAPAQDGYDLPVSRTPAAPARAVADPKPVYKYELKPEHGEFVVFVKAYQAPLAGDPHGKARELAEGLSMPLSDVEARVESMREYNPMLGLRGVRLGITVPEIYEMQARAIFEAVVEARKAGAVVTAEVMIPLVSARREVEVVQARIEAVAAKMRAHL